MGSDNLFHQRKAKLARSFNRATAKRAPYAKVLIVCEGGKTEPYYFTELRDYYQSNTTNVRVSGNCGSDPLSVINYGKKLYLEEKAKGDAYDRVYCVMDRDAHANYQQALNVIDQAKPINTFFAITSVPCFEYWLLLHFIYTTAPYSAVGRMSSGAAVLNALRAQWPEYE